MKVVREVGENLEHVTGNCYFSIQSQFLMKRLIVCLIALGVAMTAVTSCTYMKSHQQCRGTKVGNHR